MSKHDNLSDRQMIELIFDQMQQLYAAVSDMANRLTSLELKVDFLADRQNEMFIELKSHNMRLNNHEFRITKLETI